MIENFQKQKQFNQPLLNSQKNQSFSGIKSKPSQFGSYKQKNLKNMNIQLKQEVEELKNVQQSYIQQISIFNQKQKILVNKLGEMECEKNGYSEEMQELQKILELKEDDLIQQKQLNNTLQKQLNFKDSILMPNTPDTNQPEKYHQPHFKSQFYSQLLSKQNSEVFLNEWLVENKENKSLIENQSRTKEEKQQDQENLIITEQNDVFN